MLWSRERVWGSNLKLNLNPNLRPAALQGTWVWLEGTFVRHRGRDDCERREQHLSGGSPGCAVELRALRALASSPHCPITWPSSSSYREIGCRCWICWWGL